MRVIPKINILNGHCVKQLPGNDQYSEIVSHSPRKIAKMWEEQGASYLHIRDLDGLMSGHIVNHEAIKKLIHFVPIPVEVYGGIDSLKEVENVLGLGATKVVIGLNTTNYSFLKDVVANFGADKIALNLDGTHGISNTRPNDKFSITGMIELLKKVTGLGIRTIECEGIIQDKFTFAPNLDYLSRLKNESGLDVIVSGGVTTLKELELLHNTGAYGVILDSALYERRIELKNAIELFDKGANSYE